MEPIAACDTIYTISCFRNDTFLIQILNASSFYSIEVHKKAFFFFRFYSSQWQLEDGDWIFSYFTTSVAPILWVKGPMNMFIEFKSWIGLLCINTSPIPKTW